jgi:hypothetical protein
MGGSPVDSLYQSFAYRWNSRNIATAKVESEEGSHHGWNPEQANPQRQRIVIVTPGRSRE